MSSLATTISTFARGHGSIQFVAAVDAANVAYTTWDISDRYRDGTHISEADFQGRRTAADAVYQAAQDSKLKQVLT
jgi:hypothetical protein